MAANQPAAPSLFDTSNLPKNKLKNPIFAEIGGVPIYHVSKCPGEATSALMGYWYSLRADNGQPVDVRRLSGYKEPEYLPQGDPEASYLAWKTELATEAARVIGLALANGTFISQVEC